MSRALAAIALGLGPLALALPAPGSAALQPPPGFAAPVASARGGERECRPAPKPFTGALEFPSKYEGSDRARDDLNPKAEARYRAATAGINEMEKEVSAMVAHYLRTGQPGTLRCTLDGLAAWARAGALEGEARNHTGKSVRKWALASLASAWLRLKFSASRPLEAAPEKVLEIEPWLDRLATRVRDDWRDQPLEKINNHEYWAAWATMAAAVALNRRDLYDWSIETYRTAARQVDRDGYLPNELKRDTRALAYHNYSLGPLAMIAAFARANGDDLAAENDAALARLAGRVLAGVADPEGFRQRTGKKQVVDELKDKSKFAWLEPYCWVEECSGAVGRRLAALRPLKTYRLGGDVTALFRDAHN